MLTTNAIGVATATKSSARASANGWLSCGLIQLDRSPCARRNSSRKKSARPTVATSTCWPRAWRSGMNTACAEANPQADATAAARTKAMVSKGAGGQPTMASATIAAA